LATKKAPDPKWKRFLKKKSILLNFLLPMPSRVKVWNHTTQVQASTVVSEQ
jgi:hypothetical protein